MTDGLPSLPVVVDDHGSLEVYEDIAGACAELEIYDARNDGIRVFDADGKRLVVETSGYDVVGMHVASNVEPDPAYLRSRAIWAIRQIDPTAEAAEDLDALPLTNLLGRLELLQSQPRRVRSRGRSCRGVVCQWRSRRKTSD